MAKTLSQLAAEYPVEDEEDFRAEIGRGAWARIVRALTGKDDRLAFDAAKFSIGHLEIDRPALDKMTVEEAKRGLLDFFRRRGAT